MNTQKTQSGFAHIAVVVVILVIALLGALGFIFWQNFLQPKTDSTTDTKDAVSKETDTADTYKGWKTYTHDQTGVSVQYPSDWTLTDKKGVDGQLFTLAAPESTPGAKGINDVGYDVDASFEPTSGSMLASSSGADAALRLDKKGESFSDYATKKYTEKINGISVTEFDMTGQVPSFVAVFEIGDNYIDLGFVNTPTKAELTTVLKNILASVKAL